jgi:hypothetical protein
MQVSPILGVIEKEQDAHAWLQVFGLPPRQQHEEQQQGDLSVNAFRGNVSSWFAEGLPTSSIFAGLQPILCVR